MSFWTSEEKYKGTPARLAVLKHDSVGPDAVMSPLGSNVSSAATLNQLPSFNSQLGHAMNKSPECSREVPPPGGGGR